MLFATDAQTEWLLTCVEINCSIQLKGDLRILFPGMWHHDTDGSILELAACICTLELPCSEADMQTSVSSTKLATYKTNYTTSHPSKTVIIFTAMRTSKCHHSILLTASSWTVTQANRLIMAMQAHHRHSPTFTVHTPVICLLHLNDAVLKTGNRNFTHTAVGLFIPVWCWTWGVGQSEITLSLCVHYWSRSWTVLPPCGGQQKLFLLRVWERRVGYIVQTSSQRTVLCTQLLKFCLLLLR
jgi:hypothetical protein